MESGIYTFGEATRDPETGRTPAPAERLRRLLEEIELADEVGLDVFGVGEHHGPEYVVSSPFVVLAGAAVRTRTIRLTSAVSVLGSDDPVRVFQQAAPVDLLSGGRREILVGRGSFTESVPPFGYDPEDDGELFAEKLDLLLRLTESPAVEWSGRHRPPSGVRGSTSGRSRSRSPSGSPWAGLRAPPPGPGSWGFPWPSGSSVDSRNASSPWPGFTGSPRRRPAIVLPA